MEINIIVAFCKKCGIGKEGDIPWNIKKDMLHFKNITTNSIVIMGRKTYYSIKECNRPLKNRYNIVLTHNPGEYNKKERNTENVLFCDFKGFNDLYYYGNNNNTVYKSLRDTYNTMFVIGGQEIYSYFLDNYIIKNLYVTYIEAAFPCDRFFPQFLDSQFKLCSYSKKYTSENNDISYRFLTYTNKSSSQSKINENNKNGEYVYLDLIQRIVRDGIHRKDRTGTGTVAIFGNQMRFDISESIPLLTTKFVSWRAIIEELLWFLRGDTNSKILEEKSINIWKGNTSREFLDTRGLSDYSEGDIGPMYGWIWRHCGAEYTGCNTDYTGFGIDQIAEVIHMLKTDPYSRRIMMTTYDPRIKDKGCLIPCHGINLQFYVEDADDMENYISDTKHKNKKMLSASMLQRSSDSFLGLPLNIASYTVLVYIIAKLVDMVPKELVINTNDTHIYLDHIDAVNTQLSRECYPFPKLVISDDILNIDMKDYKIEHFDLIGYIYHPLIKGKMSV